MFGTQSRASFAGVPLVFPNPLRAAAGLVEKSAADRDPASTYSSMRVNVLRQGQLGTRRVTTGHSWCGGTFSRNQRSRASMSSGATGSRSVSGTSGNAFFSNSLTESGRRFGLCVTTISPCDQDHKLTGMSVHLHLTLQMTQESKKTKSARGGGAHPGGFRTNR